MAHSCKADGIHFTQYHTRASCRWPLDLQVSHAEMNLCPSVLAFLRCSLFLAWAYQWEIYVVGFVGVTSHAWGLALAKIKWLSISSLLKVSCPLDYLCIACTFSIIHETKGFAILPHGSKYGQNLSIYCIPKKKKSNEWFSFICMINYIPFPCRFLPYVGWMTIIMTENPLIKVCLCWIFKAFDMQILHFHR